MTLWRLGVVAASKKGVAPATTHAYVAGGYIGSPLTRYSDIQKYGFAADSVSTITDTISPGREYSHGFASRTVGYIAGGRPYSAVIDKVTFATDTRSAGTSLSAERAQPQAFAGLLKGYIIGGRRSPDGVTQSNTSTYFFATDTLGTADAASAGTYAGVGVGAPDGTFGYAHHGNATTVVDKWTVATDVRSTLGTGRSESVNQAACGFGSTTHASMLGGLISASPTVQRSNVHNRFAFATDTRDNSTTLEAVGDRRTGFSSTTAGYVAAGTSGAPSETIIATVQKYTYSDYSRSSTTSINTVRMNPAAAPNSQTNL